MDRECLRTTIRNRVAYLLCPVERNTLWDIGDCCKPEPHLCTRCNKASPIHWDRRQMQVTTFNGLLSSLRLRTWWLCRWCLAVEVWLLGHKTHKSTTNKISQSFLKCTSWHACEIATLHQAKVLPFKSFMCWFHASIWTEGSNIVLSKCYHLRPQQYRSLLNRLGKISLILGCNIL